MTSTEILYFIFSFKQPPLLSSGILGPPLPLSTVDVICAAALHQLSKILKLNYLNYINMDGVADLLLLATSDAAAMQGGC